MDEIRDEAHHAESPPKKRIVMLFLFVGIVGGLVLFAAVAVWYFKRVDELPPPDMPTSIGHSVLIPTGVFRENEASTVLYGTS